MGYILILKNLQSWIIDPNHFLKELKKRSKNLSFEEIIDLAHPYSYSFKIDIDNKIEGFIHKNNDSIHIEGQFEDCVDFALICREIIPERETITFLDDSYNGHIDLLPEMTKDEIINAF